ncbi:MULTISPECIES: EAL domain-containing protein [unclassified Vibrio]|uniref:EAL domain-containing protein n=1 Tax=unclassified Vibrio TaxID=2614977 RepID=UPI000B8E4118|nr:MULTISPECIES: EAL domain-containing protein [unclassified Vibrio]NAW90985.1 EAL domain-containing protein [Vibrio sp. V24_P1S3T111]OXX22044.1 diguanylate cyclase [Vibrio sp. V06_P1A73T115]OXX24487.1 diguanylate cyclase [Vibrio sp. V05_P4A8T149]OXX29260.1 diguanylate cyclase [Vibrio sp. V14_P6S14T42]OXX30145.1 diguanylate cyclase [Vibrio sp. V04_P4A5T148]
MMKNVFPTSVLQLFNTTSEGLWFMTRDNVVAFYNTPFYEQFNMPLVGSTLDDWLALVHPEDREKLQNKVNTHQQEASSERVKTRYRVKNRLGHYLWIEAVGTLVEQDGDVLMVGTHKNVSEEVFLNQYLSHIASHDSETGLYNRHQFLKDMVKFDENGWLFVCCFTQLHEAQRRFGQEATSRLISTLVSVLDETLSLRYGLYRISADTLVFTVEQPMTPKRTMTLMQEVEACFLEQEGAREVTLTTQLGLGALSRSDMESAQLLLTQVFNLSEYTRLVESPITYAGPLRKKIVRYFQIEDALDTAIAHRQIDIALQPIVASTTGDLVSYEALARWTHPVLGAVSPGEFIPTAEKLGYIHALGMVVLEKACEFLSEFDKVHQSRPSVNVNVSVQQLLKPTFIDDVMTVVTESQLSPSRVVLEITESYLLENTYVLMTTLKALHRRGFKLSIDDFGAGMTAITGLFSLPLYQVKLDRALVIEAMRLSACLKLVSYLCDYGRSHGITIVAEGVETTEMFDRLTSIGVPYLQGFCLYRPCAPDVWLTSGVVT